MDAIVFGLKRAHLVVNHRFAAKVLESSGLTPARFDLLYKMREKSQIAQRELRRTLGVSAPTVSRMLKSLERLNLVRRGIYMRGRVRTVSLTQMGRWALRHAIHKTLRRQRVRRVIDETIHHGPDGKFTCRLELDGFLALLRQKFNDTAWCSYRWHPDD